MRYAVLVAVVACAVAVGAQQEGQFDQAAVDRGKELLVGQCGFCHGSNARGGSSGPDLTRSELVQSDEGGKELAAFLRNGRPDKGMPAFELTAQQVKDVAEFLHSSIYLNANRRLYKVLDIVVGDAKAGEAYFGRTCGSCHSATGDLRGYASRFADEKQMQQTWMMPGSGGRGAAPPKLNVPPMTVTVTLPSGEMVEGVLDRIDDFVVSLTTRDGTHRSFRTTGETPKVEIHDPLEPHRQLLAKYSDADIHNVTAYLATLK